MTSRITEAPEFDVCGPLPTGITVLEASAGTGKTYAIAALAARYVATGTPLDQLLLVTFTRMATSELRDRIREQLTRTEQELSRILAGAPPTNPDPVVDLLADGCEGEVARRADRLAQAVTDFDAATIATTHGFCQEVLSGLGIAADVDPATIFVEDLTDLLEEVVDDLYIRRFHHRDTPPFNRAEAMSIAQIAIANPTVPIEPRDAQASSVAAMRFRLANAVRTELEARKRRMGVMSFDDLLTRLSSVLAGYGAASAVERLRQRYRVVLVDEFQDTDPLQWEIVERAFGGGGVTLILVADPKQAIYAFRGADVYAYLDAARAAGSRATLRVNWRSDQGLIDAYDAVFGEAKLGDEGIVYRSVRAADGNVASRLTGAPITTPLRIRIARRTEHSIGTTPKGYARKDPAERHIARDLAADLAGVLSSPAEVAVRERGEERRERVRPGHIAVLVRTHRSAALVRDALDAVGIPAVINGAGSVFGTVAAREWLRFLEAIERPTSSLRAHAAALTSFLGWSAEQVAKASDAEWETIHGRLHQWAAVLRARGVASLMETVDLMENLPARVLANADGERHLTDLRHIGQLLHGAAVSERMGAAALVGWLERRIEEAATDTGDEERSRRLESDAQAVQILTIHRSKGLEFPIVYCPYLWRPSWVRERVPIFFHDADAGNARTIDVGLDGGAYQRHYRQHVFEERGEDLRLAYVALTRARHQAVIWWAGTWDSRNSPLTRLLFARDADGNVAHALDSPPSDAEAEKRFIELAEAAPGSISIEASTFGAAPHWTPEKEGAGPLSAASFDREIDRAWRRTSYSDITAGAYEARVASEPEEAVLSDEPSGPSLAAAVDGEADRDLFDTPSLFRGIPVSLHVGTFVHRVLEETDFAAPDLEEELRVQLAREQGHRDVDVGEPAELVAALRAAAETPLGPLVDGLRLRDVGWRDRLQEAEFELPLVGGDRPAGRLTLEAMAELLRQELEPDDPFAGYAARLGDPSLRASLRGFLAGSIDLVVRVPGARGDPRFAVVDYKTNWLAGRGDELTAWHYRPAALADEMGRGHYPLQALLYAVALHRYLRWRVPSYDPDKQFAGVLYLFLRGMSGPETPNVGGHPCGVFSWRPPNGFLAKLSDLLDGQPG